MEARMTPVGETNTLPAETKAQPRYVVGGDLGGTRFRVAIADDSGKIVRRNSCLTEADKGLDAVLDRMETMIRDAIIQSEKPIEAVGIAAPGPLDPWKGIVFSPPNLKGWNEVHLKDILESRLKLPVYLGNDANLAALAEWRFGAGKGADCVTYVTVSTGVGGGVIDHGRMILGHGGGAVEVGHMTVEMDGPYCNCGNRGCLEALSSGTAIARRAVERLQTGIESKMNEMVGGKLDRISAEVVVQAARDGDEVAGEVMRRAGYALGVGLANLMHLYDSEVIVLGGGVTNAGELLFAPMREAIAERAMKSFRDRCRIEVAALGDDVGLYGAAALALENHKH